MNKKRGAFPNPEAVRKVLYLAITKASFAKRSGTNRAADHRVREALIGPCVGVFVYGKGGMG